MPQRTRVDGPTGETESKFYHPAGSDPPFVVSQLERIWKMLFTHEAEI